MSVPYLSDPDGSLRGDVEALRVTEVIDQSPVGRMRSLDAASHAVVEDMYSILTGEAGITDPREYEEALQDLTDQLGDLHKETDRATGLAVIARWFNGKETT